MKTKKKMWIAVLAVLVLAALAPLMSASAVSSDDWTGDYVRTMSGETMSVRGTATYGKKIRYAEKVFMNGLEMTVKINPEETMDFIAIIFSPNRTAYVQNTSVISIFIRNYGSNVLVELVGDNAIVVDSVTMAMPENGEFAFTFAVSSLEDEVSASVNGREIFATGNKNVNYSVFRRGLFCNLGVNGGSGDLQSATFEFWLTNFVPGAQPADMPPVHYGCYITEDDELIKKLEETNKA